ncbi:TULIP family P47-like protein [Enterobacter cancerogenus]
MYNWDMVCATRCSRLNDRLKEEVHKNLGAFSFTDPAGNQISGEFGSWEIVPGGDAQRINLITPVTTGTLMVAGTGEQSITFDGLCPKLQIELAFVSGGNGNADTHLTFNLRKVCQASEVQAGEGAVVILNADTTHLFQSTLAPQGFCEMLAQMLVDRCDDLRFVFAELLAMDGDSAWMKLHQLNYAYSEGISGTLGSLAVLGILADNPSPPSSGDLQLVFDSTLIREGGSSGFMVSQAAFIRHVVLPGLPAIFVGSSEDDFSLGSDGVIHNSGNIPLNAINGYTPYFTSLSMHIVDNRLVISSASGRCDVVYDSSWVTFDLSGSYTTSLTREGNIYRIGIDAVTGPDFSIEKHDTAALVFWIFGGWAVDALLEGIKSQMKTFLWSFDSYRMSFDILPVRFHTDVDYTNCGLAENFWMRD